MRSGWRVLAERAVRPMPVVVVQVFLKHHLEVARPEDDEPVTALSSDGADDPFADGVGPRRPDGTADHLDIIRAEHGVEAGRELGVAVADQEPESTEAIRQFPCALGDPRLRRVGGDAARWTRRVPCSMKTST